MGKDNFTLGEDGRFQHQIEDKMTLKVRVDQQIRLCNKTLLVSQPSSLDHL